MPKYEVTVEGWVTVEATSAEDAWGIVDSAIGIDLYNSLKQAGEDVGVSLQEPKKRLED